MKRLIKHNYDHDDYLSEVVGIELSLDQLHDDELKLFDAIDFFNRCAPPDFVGKKMAALRAVMARTNESANDISLVIETYSEHLEQYPPDVVAFVIDKTIATKKWFPLVSELREEMEGLMRFRRALRDLFERKRNPLLAAQDLAKRIETDPRHGQHWKTLDRVDWLPCHFESAIEEVSKMLELARQNPTILSVELWEGELAKLDAYQDCVRCPSARQTADGGSGVA